MARDLFYVVEPLFYIQGLVLESATGPLCCVMPCLVQFAHHILQYGCTRTLGYFAPQGGAVCAFFSQIFFFLYQQCIFLHTDQ